MPYKLEDLKFPGYDQPFTPAAAKPEHKQPVRSSILDMLRPKEMEVEKKEEPVEIEAPKVQQQPKPEPVKKAEPVAKPEPVVVPEPKPEPKPAEEIMQKIIKKQPKKLEEVMVQQQPVVEETFLEPAVSLGGGLKDECEYEYMSEPKYEGYGGAVEKAKDLLKITFLALTGIVVIALVIRGIMLLFSI